MDDSGYFQISSVNAIRLTGPPRGDCNYRCFFILNLTLKIESVGSKSIRDPSSPHPQPWVFNLGSLSVWVLVNALNTPPGTLRWQHEIQRNCTAVYTNRVRMWFNRYTA